MSVASGYRARRCATTPGPTYPMFPVIRIFIGTARGRLPDLPRRVSRCPLVLENHFVSEGIHVLPVARVLVGAEHAVASKTLERLALPDGEITFDVVQGTGLENEEASVDPGSIPAWLLGETRDLVLFAPKRE